MRIGSLFTGVAGLDMAVQDVFGGAHAWFSEIDKAASRVLEYRWPGVPNLGDITQIDWATVEPVDVLCGGFPCQDVSAAGKRAGIKHGTRSGLWALFAEAIDALRPQHVVIENVRGLLSAAAHRTVEDDAGDYLEPDPAGVGDGAGRPVLRAAGAVLGDLADLGYDAVWATVAAADVGAPHRRERVFIIATASDANVYRPGWDGFPSQRGEPAQSSVTGGQYSLSGVRSSDEGDAADAEGSRRSVRDTAHIGQADREVNAFADDFGIAAHSSRNGWDEGRPESAGFVGGFDAAVSGDEPGVALLPTPTTQDGANNGGPSQFQRNTLPLNAEVTLLPTPNASDGSGGGQHPDKREGHSRQLIDYVLLLQTPQARDGKGLPGDGFNKGNLLSQVIDAADGCCHPADARLISDSAINCGVCSCRLSVGDVEQSYRTQWGKYEPAIRRWEQVTGQPAPPPTEPNKNGNPRLSAAFSEWLMGWPAGWVTDPAIGISRNDQLRCVGNGVVTLQAVAALRYLLGVAAASEVAANG